MTEQVLAGKTRVVFGVANKRSIAWPIATAWAAAGARLIFNYQGERLKENVEELVSEFGAETPLYPCDVSNDEEIGCFFGKCAAKPIGSISFCTRSRSHQRKRSKAIPLARRERLRTLCRLRERFRISPVRIAGCPKHLILDAFIHCASDRTLLRSQDTIDFCESQVCKNRTIRSLRD
jgi:NAD(P)-dependent dehydrogenase (short-subunit alcohol dehydrogenase family)